MISAHDVAIKAPDSAKIAADVAAFLAAGGQIRQAAASDYDHQAIRERLTERTRDGWDNRAGKGVKALTGQPRPA